MSPLETAILVAVEAHAGQVDKAGAPYAFHPLRLMLKVKTDEERMAAVLHDVVEDGPRWTFERLIERGIPQGVVDAVRHLTKWPEEAGDYMAFIRRGAAHPVARVVKLADLEDNMDLTRISEPAPRDFERIEKYRIAREYLLRVTEQNA